MSAAAGCIFDAFVSAVSSSCQRPPRLLLPLEVMVRVRRGMGIMASIIATTTLCVSVLQAPCNFVGKANSRSGEDCLIDTSNFICVLPQWGALLFSQKLTPMHPAVVFHVWPQAVSWLWTIFISFLKAMLFGFWQITSCWLLLWPGCQPPWSIRQQKQLPVISEFTSDIAHIHGVTIIVPDALSYKMAAKSSADKPEGGGGGLNSHLSPVWQRLPRMSLWPLLLQCRLSWVLCTYFLAEPTWLGLRSGTLT